MLVKLGIISPNRGLKIPKNTPSFTAYFIPDSGNGLWEDYHKGGPIIGESPRITLDEILQTLNHKNNLHSCLKDAPWTRPFRGLSFLWGSPSKRDRSRVVSTRRIIPINRRSLIVRRLLNSLFGREGTWRIIPGTCKWLYRITPIYKP